VDALRAGQVAILDGGFRYFHDASCKVAYVEATSRRPSLEAMTAEPPPVASGGVTVVTGPVLASAVGARDAVDDDAPSPAFPAPPSAAGAPRHAFDLTPPPEPALATPAPAHASAASSVDAPPASSPSTLRSPASSPSVSEPPPAAEPSSPPPPAPRGPSSPRAAPKKPPGGAGSRDPRSAALLLAFAPPLGIAAGILAVAFALAGASALALRLPLALLAAVLAIASSLFAPHAREERTRALLGAMPLAATLVASLAVSVLAPARTEVFAVLLGLASASELLAELVLARARRDVDGARASVLAALDGTAKVVRGEATETIAAPRVKPGDAVLVEVGEVVQVDGQVAFGSAEIVPWLDSPSLVEKREGDAVVAGAQIASGSLRITAAFSGTDRAWLRLGQPGPTSIEGAAPLLTLARRFAAPVAVAAAGLAGLLVFASNGTWPDVLLVACATGSLLAARVGVSATGMAHARAHVAAQRRGIVYKDAGAFDRAGRADVAVLCSRGTVLLGEPEIVAVESAGARGPSSGDGDAARVLALAAGAEMGSTHPFATAIGRAARARAVRPESVRSAIGHSGLGVTALVSSGERVVVGSRAFLLQEKISVAVAEARIAELEGQGRSVLLVAVAEKLVGLLALQDGLRPGARAAVQRLHDADIEPVLLSGEARETSESLARSLDIDHVRPEVLPSDRGAEVRALADNGHVVAAIGHPATDDGALGSADVSVAMGAAGGGPGEWAIALASDDVRDAALALAIPRACRERCRTALAIGGGAQAAATLAVVFGVLPAAAIPLAGAAAVVVVAAVVRDVSSSYRG
jgi:cation transport ATPase